MRQNATLRRDTELLEALAQGQPVSRAAEAAGMSRTAAYRRLHDPSFMAQLAEIRTTVTQALSVRLAALGDGAINTLLAVMVQEAPPAGSAARVRAAEVIIHGIFRLPAPDFPPPGYLPLTRDPVGVTNSIRAALDAARRPTLGEVMAAADEGTPAEDDDLSEG